MTNQNKKAEMLANTEKTVKALQDTTQYLSDSIKIMGETIEALDKILDVIREKQVQNTPSNRHLKAVK